MKRSGVKVRSGGQRAIERQLNQLQLSRPPEAMVVADDGRLLEAPQDYMRWLKTLFPSVYTRELAPYHHEFWQWIWSASPERTSEFVFIWPRGFSKTTNSERAVIKLADLGFRYVLYVKGTQEGADDAVQNIAALLESREIEEYYPQLAERQVGKYGNSKGWRRNRLRTASGFVVDAAGLDTKVRGLLVEGSRPDVIIIDDVDDTHDSIEKTEKKLRTLKSDILPAGAPNRLVIAVQNLVSPHGIFTRLANINPEFPPDFLLNARVSGPHPAIVDFEYEQVPTEDGRAYFRIVRGASTWPEGRPLEMLEAELNQLSPQTFIEEKQHDVLGNKGSLYNAFNFNFTQLDFKDIAAFKDTPSGVWDLDGLLALFEDVHVWCDPAVTDTEKSDCNGIRAGGRLQSGMVIGIYSWEGRESVDEVLRRAILKAVEYRASTLGVETNQGGDTWESLYDKIWDLMVEDPTYPMVTTSTPKPRFMQAKASVATGTKRERWMLTKSARENGLFKELKGTHETLFKALKRLPEHKPYDLADVDYWLYEHLRPTGRTQKRTVIHHG